MHLIYQSSHAHPQPCLVLLQLQTHEDVLSNTLAEADAVGANNDHCNKRLFTMIRK